MVASSRQRKDFYEAFLMARNSIDPHLYGIEMNREEFIDLIIEQFSEYTRGQISLDELLLRPRSAIHFCDDLRQKHGFFDLPDDIILKSIMQRRKNP